MTTICRESISSSIESTKGRIFSVKFVKANGEIRDMTCRTGVTQHLAGGKSTTSHKSHLRAVWDLGAKGYRTINMDTMLEMKAFGSTFNLR